MGCDGVASCSRRRAAPALACMFPPTNASCSPVILPGVREGSQTGHPLDLGGKAVYALILWSSDCFPIVPLVLFKYVTLAAWRSVALLRLLHLHIPRRWTVHEIRKYTLFSLYSTDTTMANGSHSDLSGLPSPDPAASEGNSSVQVNVDSSSNR